MKLSNDTNTLIAKLILSTRRKKRKDDLIQVANNINELSNELGGIDKVSKVLGLKRDILNRILSVLKLSPRVQNMFKNKSIDGIFLAYYLNSFNKTDQFIVADKVKKGILTTNDVRSLAPFRKRNSKIDILVLINRLLNSKNIKVKIAYLQLPNKDINIQKFRHKLENIIGSDNFISFETQGFLGILKVNEKGWKKIQNISKLEKQSTRENLNNILNRI